MAVAPDLIVQLQALQAHYECTQQDLHELLLSHALQGQGWSPSTFSNTLNARHRKPRRTAQISKALAAHVTAHELNLAKIVERHTFVADSPQPVSPAVPTGRRVVSDQLRGFWFLVQYRGKRSERAERIANEDLRIGVMLYGSDRKEGRNFQLIGQSTLWEGYVSTHPQDPFLYYTAEEKQRVEISERVRLLMHAPFPDAQHADHHGIILGIGRGPHDSPNPPIYASRVLLSRIQNDELQRIRPPLQPPDIARLKQYCGYFPYPTGKEQANSDDELVAERNKAMKMFLERASTFAQERGNFGDRIYVRF